MIENRFYEIDKSLIDATKEEYIKQGWKEIGEDNALLTTLYFKHDNGGVNILQCLKNKEGIKHQVYLDEDLLKEILNK